MSPSITQPYGATQLADEIMQFTDLTALHNPNAYTVSFTYVDIAFPFK